LLRQAGHEFAQIAVFHVSKVIRDEFFMLDWLFQGCLESAPIDPEASFFRVYPGGPLGSPRCQPWWQAR
jgi:hypothetical protein